jgi:alkylated DNA repair dioxygenase AlkB
LTSQRYRTYRPSGLLSAGVRRHAATFDAVVGIDAGPTYLKAAMIRSSLKPFAAVQSDLFGGDPSWPEGLQYEPCFLTAEEENRLIKALASLPMAQFQFGAFEGRRRVASFGYRYDFGDQRLHDAAPIPDFVRPMVVRAEALAGLAPGDVRHALVTEYEIGAGIGWHRDKAAFDVVLGISIGSSCPFRFRRKAGAGWERFTLEAEPRSIYVMTGPSRSAWEHSIAPVSHPRWSITLRTMKR